MGSPGRLLALGLAGALSVAASAAALPTGSAASAPAAASPRSAPDGVLGSFSPLGQGMNYTVWSIVRWDGKIVAAYDGGTASGVPGTNYIAAWSDDTWRGLGGGTDGAVKRLATWSNNTLVAGGNFTSAGGRTDDSYVATWSDDTWRGLGAGVDRIINEGALVPWTDDSLVVGGPFTSAGGVAGTAYIAVWSGSTWHALGAGVQERVYAIAKWTDDTIVAGGEFRDASGILGTNRIAAWSNADDTWHALGRGTNDSVRALAAFTDDTIVAGGLFDRASGVSGTNLIAAWSNVDDTWHPLGNGLDGTGSRLVRALATDANRGLIYAGGDFPGAIGSTASMQRIGVWDTGLQAWIPFTYAPGLNGGFSEREGVMSLLVEGSNVYLGGDFESVGGGVAGTKRIARWTWQPPQAYDDSNIVASLPVTLHGEGFIGVPATGGVTFGGVPAIYTRDDSTQITVTALPGTAYNGSAIRVNGVGGWGVVGTCTPPACPDPPPIIPPSAPGGVTAAAADASAAVTWTPPTSPGTYPVTTYQVTSSPGGHTCLTSALTCTVTGLTNGTAYTFTVKALSGAGWGASSTPSNAVTPTAPPTPSITITGSRDGQRITVTGTSMHLTSQTVRPWLRFPGETTYSEGAAVIPVSANGTFTWSRKTGKKTYVYVAHATTKSNTVTIPAR